VFFLSQQISEQYFQAWLFSQTKEAMLSQSDPIDSDGRLIAISSLFFFAIKLTVQ
jgi:hypothetical protein